MVCFVKLACAEPGEDSGCFYTISGSLSCRVCCLTAGTQNLTNAYMPLGQGCLLEVDDIKYIFIKGKQSLETRNIAIKNGEGFIRNRKILWYIKL